VKVPAGSAGLGGAQYCIYSVDSPGGYWLLGRTPVRLYDPEADGADLAAARRSRAHAPDRSRGV
jgi:allophanate hydrolase subunit 1